MGRGRVLAAAAKAHVPNPLRHRPLLVVTIHRAAPVQGVLVDCAVGVHVPEQQRVALPRLHLHAPRQRMSACERPAAPIPALPWNLALLKGASIVGVFWGDFAKREPQKNAEMMVTLTDWYEYKKIKPFIDSTMPMDQLMQAYERMNSRAVQGKLVMVNPE